MPRSRLSLLCRATFLGHGVKLPNSSNSAFPRSYLKVFEPPVITVTVPGHCRSVKQYPHAEMPRGMLLLRIDAPIYYANVEVSQH